MVKDVLFIERGKDEIHDRFFGPLVEDLSGQRLHRLSIRQALSSYHLQKKDYRAILLDCLTVSEQEASILLRVSRLTEGLPILLTAKHIEVRAYRELGKIPNLKALQRFFDVRDFQAHLRVMCSGVPYRAGPATRFKVDHHIRLYVDRTRETFRGRVKNYSAGGMFVECVGRPPRPGEIVQLAPPPHLIRSPIQFNEHLMARSVWEKGHGVGLQFV